MKNQKQLFSYIILIILSATLVLSCLYIPMVHTVIETGATTIDKNFTLLDFIKNGMSLDSQVWNISDGAPVWLLSLSITLNLATVAFSLILSVVSLFGIVAYIFKHDSNNHRVGFKTIGVMAGLVGLVTFVLTMVSSVLINGSVADKVTADVLVGTYVNGVCALLILVFTLVGSTKKRDYVASKFASVFGFVAPMLLCGGFIFCMLQPIFQPNFQSYLGGETITVFSKEWYDMAFNSDSVAGLFIKYGLYVFGAICILSMLFIIAFGIVGIVKTFTTNKTERAGKVTRTFARIFMIAGLVQTVLFALTLIANKEFGSVLLNPTLEGTLSTTYGNTSLQIFSLFTLITMVIPTLIVIFGSCTSKGKYVKEAKEESVNPFAESASNISLKEFTFEEGSAEKTENEQPNSEEIAQPEENKPEEINFETEEKVEEPVEFFNPEPAVEQEEPETEAEESQAEESQAEETIETEEVEEAEEKPKTTAKRTTTKKSTTAKKKTATKKKTTSKKSTTAKKKTTSSSTRKVAPKVTPVPATANDDSTTSDSTTGE